MATSIVPGIYHEQQLDGKIPVSTEDAYEMVYALGQFEGILSANRRGPRWLRRSSSPAACARVPLSRFSATSATNISPPISGSDGRNGAGNILARLLVNGTYPRTLLSELSRGPDREPILYQLVKKFDLVFNIRGASVSEDMGLVAVEFEGTTIRSSARLAWLRADRRHRRTDREERHRIAARHGRACANVISQWR